MKTTNLISDFLIIGFIMSLSFYMPFVIYFNLNIPQIFMFFKGIDTALVIVLFTGIIYVLGIVFNQISDYMVKILDKFLRHSSIKSKEEEMEESLNDKYHNMVQKIVYASQTSFEYLSYRRTIIRIIRSTYIGIIIFLAEYLIICIGGAFMINSVFSLTNLFVILIIIIMGIFIRYTYIRVYRGYYDAVYNFIVIINNSLENKDE